MAKKNSASALAEAIGRARSLATEMAQATDDLNLQLTEAERAIAELNLGVTADVLMSGPDESDPYSQYLTFGKDGGQWRLLVTVGLDGDDDWDITPLIKSSRLTRLQAVEHLSTLVTKLTERAQAEVTEVRQKAEAVKELTLQLKDIPF